MTPAAKVELSGADTLCLSGDLLFSTVMPVQAKVHKQLRDASGSWTIDFSAVGRVDSSALSLWLSCLRLAATQGVELKAQQVPEELKSIAELVGLEQLLA